MRRVCAVPTLSGAGVWVSGGSWLHRPYYIPPYYISHQHYPHPLMIAAAPPHSTTNRVPAVLQTTTRTTCMFKASQSLMCQRKCSWLLRANAGRHTFNIRLEDYIDGSVTNGDSTFLTYYPSLRTVDLSPLSDHTSVGTTLCPTVSDWSRWMYPP